MLKCLTFFFTVLIDTECVTIRSRQTLFIQFKHYPLALTTLFRMSGQHVDNPLIRPLLAYMFAALLESIADQECDMVWKDETGLTCLRLGLESRNRVHWRALSS